MARLGRPGGLSAAGKKELWERWRAGESISDIARALQKAPGSIHGMIEATGGISPPQSDVGADVHSPPPSGRRSPGELLPESLFVRSPSGWAGLPPPCVGR